MFKYIFSIIVVSCLFGCESFVTTPPHQIGSFQAYYVSSGKKEEPVLSPLDCVVSNQIETGYPTVAIFSKEKRVGLELQVANATLLRDELVKVQSGEKEMKKLSVVMNKGLWNMASYTPLKTSNGESTFMVIALGVSPIYFSQSQIPQVIEILNTFILEHPEKK
jgi:hypothetical protein